MEAIPENMKKALKRIGFTDDKISQYSGSSLIVQDLGIWGDDFEEFYTIVCKIYDATPLLEERFIPAEFSWMKHFSGWNIFRPLKKVQKSEPLSIIQLHEIMINNGDF